MDRLANLETVLNAILEGIADANWSGAERLTERVMSVVLEAAMAADRPSLDRMRERLAAFRSAATRRLNLDDPIQLALSVHFRADAALAAIAARAPESTSAGRARS